jgi:hypothetical protein
MQSNERATAYGSVPLDVGLPPSFVRTLQDDERELAALPYRSDEAILRVLVTPAIAGRWLQTNRRNRILRPHLIKRYAQQMREGRWTLNGECIKFTASGYLLDGQHRLRAIIEADVPVVLEVRVGLPESAGLTIDTGAVRTATDVISMRGLTQWESRVMAGAIRLLLNHERSGAMWSVARVDNRDVDDYFTAHQPLYVSLHSIKSACHQHSRLYPFPLALALHFLFAHVDSHDADNFFYRLYHGVNIRGDEALHWLRRYCESTDDPQSTTRRTYDLALRTVKCWNLTREGETVLSIKKLAPHADDSKLPEVV